MRWLDKTDPQGAEAIRRDTEGQQRRLGLIASKNFVSEVVLRAVGSMTRVLPDSHGRIIKV